MSCGRVEGEIGFDEWGIFSFDIPNNICRLTTGNAKEQVIKKELKFAVDYSNKLLGFVKDMGGFDHKDVLDVDAQSFFVRPIPRACGDEIVMEPVEEALVNSCSMLGQHYTYTAVPPPRCICRTRWQRWWISWCKWQCWWVWQWFFVYWVITVT